MSKPRYDWWSYVKGMIRRYPELCARQNALHQAQFPCSIITAPNRTGKISDPVADSALSDLPEINRREMEAVRQAIEATKRIDTGEERIRMIRMVYWDRTYTLEGAAQKCHISYTTGCRWHREFIYHVAVSFGLL